MYGNENSGLPSHKHHLLEPLKHFIDTRKHHRNQVPSYAPVPVPVYSAPPSYSTLKKDSVFRVPITTSRDNIPVTPIRPSSVVPTPTSFPYISLHAAQTQPRTVGDDIGVFHDRRGHRAHKQAIEYHNTHALREAEITKRDLELIEAERLKNKQNVEQLEQEELEKAMKQSLIEIEKQKMISETAFKAEEEEFAQALMISKELENDPCPHEIELETPSPYPLSEEEEKWSFDDFSGSESSDEGDKSPVKEPTFWLPFSNNNTVSPSPHKGKWKARVQFKERLDNDNEELSQPKLQLTNQHRHRQVVFTRKEPGNVTLPPIPDLLYANTCAVFARFPGRGVTSQGMVTGNPFQKDDHKWISRLFYVTSQVSTIRDWIESSGLAPLRYSMRIAFPKYLEGILIDDLSPSIQDALLYPQVEFIIEPR